MKKFIVTEKQETKELTFFEAVKKFDVDKNTKRVQIQKDYYDLLKINQDEFNNITSIEESEATVSKRAIELTCN